MTSYIDQPCERCGSKKRISKTWFEYTPNFNGKSKVECAKIVCTNDECQEKFEQKMKSDTDKQTKIRQNKEANDIARKKNALTARANKLKTA